MSRASPSPSSSSPPTTKRKQSQFAGAAAMFQQKEQDLLKKHGSTKNITPLSPKPSPMTKFGNASMNAAALSSYKSPQKQSSSSSSTFSSLAAVSPPFGSPSRPTWNSYPTSSYLNKPNGVTMTTTTTTTTPTQLKNKNKIVSPGGFQFSPSPVTSNNNNNNNHKKVDGSSWKDQISFQGVTSPGSGRSGSKTFKMDTDASSMEQQFEDVADVSIQVNIPNIDQKIQARRRAAQQQQQQQQQQMNKQQANIPEWQLKFQQREANRIRKEKERQEQAMIRLQAVARRFITRLQYPKWLEDNKDRLQKMKERELLHKQKQSSALMIQKVFRSYVPRKRFLFVRECRRRRIQNEKEMKRIQKVIKNMPKNTKSEIKDMKKDYAEKKKKLKKQLKQTLKEDDKKLASIASSGKSMMEYLKNENEKLIEQQKMLEKEYQLLEKQTDVLNQKTDELAQNFASLQAFVDKKQASIQKNEVNSQKCRHRYLPKYRSMLKDRDKHCLVEHKIAALYKRRLEQIVELLSENSSTNSSLVFDAKEAVASCQYEIDNMPKLPVPESLKDQW